METIHQPSTLTSLFTKLITNITQPKIYEKLKSDLININTPQEQVKSNQNIKQIKLQPSLQKVQSNKELKSASQSQHISQKLEYQIEFPEAITERKQEAEIQKTNSKNNTKAQNPPQQRQIKFIPLEYPSSYQPKNDISKHIRQQAVEVRHHPRQSSEEQSINLQLTQKTKITKNLSNTLAKQDSLMYSDATLMYSNATGFGLQPIQHTGLQKAHRTQSHKSVLRQIQDGDGEQMEISTKMERAVSRQVQRGHKHTDTSQEESLHANIKSQPKESAIFQTEVADYKNKIAKIRQIKQRKKRLLESQLNKVNRQIDELARKQSESRVVKSNNFESRVKIADNTVAQAKAERLVRGLQREKRARFQAHLDEMQVIDKNINNYMQELMKERYKNEERIKQKKKLQIIQRMKQQELRKIQEQKQKELNVRFVSKLKDSNSRQQIQPKVVVQPQNVKPTQDKKSEILKKQRTPTRKSENIQESEVTSELSRKKAFLKKVRNISFKKQKPDAYQQVLM